MPSPIEKIFEAIFGSLPKKSGTAYEQLAAIAMHVLDDGQAQHDARIRGQFSETLYQLDVKHMSADGAATMAEAKDYSELGSKVGRGDLQKLVGALPDLEEISSGAFFSATGYTKPARKYANAAEDISGGKQIRLYELCSSTEKDEQGFIKTIVINMHFSIPHPDRGEFRAVFTKAGDEVLKATLLKEGEQSKTISYKLSEFYDSAGVLVLSLPALTSAGYGEVNEDDKCAHACFWLPDKYVRIEDLFVPIQGLEYKIPFTDLHRELRVSDESQHRFVVRDENGVALRILTDEKLRGFTFDADGNVVRRSE